MSSFNENIFVKGTDTGLTSSALGLSYPHVIRYSEESLEMLAVGWSQDANIFRNDLIYLEFGKKSELIGATCVSEATDFGLGSTCIRKCIKDQGVIQEYAVLTTTFRRPGLEDPVYDVAPYSLKLDAGKVWLQQASKDIAPKPSFRSVSYPAFDQKDQILLVSARNQKYQTLAFHFRGDSFSPISINGPLSTNDIQYASMFYLLDRRYVIASLGRYGDAGLGIFEVELW